MNLILRPNNLTMIVNAISLISRLLILSYKSMVRTSLISDRLASPSSNSRSGAESNPKGSVALLDSIEKPNSLSFQVIAGSRAPFLEINLPGSRSRSLLRTFLEAQSSGAPPPSTSTSPINSSKENSVFIRGKYY